jgi:HlyD family secretion protein
MQLEKNKQMNIFMKKITKISLYVIIGLTVLITFKFLWDASRPKVTIYEIISPEIGDIQAKVIVTGNIEPRNEVYIKPQISGLISHVLREAGEKVRQGDIIATIKVTTEMEQLNSAESRLNIAEINLKQIKLDYERQTMLYQSDVISKNEYEAIEAGYSKALEERNSARDALDIVLRGSAKRHESLSNTQIRSTITGTILSVPVKEGSYVIQSNAFNDGTTIAMIANMNDLIFKGYIDETEVGTIQTGMPTNLIIGAINNETFDATLEYISPKGTKENGTVLYEIKAAVKAAKSIAIRADYSANAEIITDQSKNVIIIPESSIEFNNNSAFIYILKNENPQKFEKKEIEIGLSDGVFIEVKKGLNLEDKIRGAIIE